MTTDTLSSRPSVSDASTPSRSEHGVHPLPPLDRPRGLLTRLIFFGSRQRFGKVPTGFRILYPRAPALAWVTVTMVAVLSRFLKLDATTQHLVRVGLAGWRGCTFCADLSLAEALRAKLGRERFAALSEFETSPCFDERERAALAYAAAVAESLHVPDAVFERLRRSFDEREIVELVWICAVESYFNTMALPLRIGSDHLAA
ncbi:MAG: carboxymuconolactone decarboxylase family protein [Sandaracinus sp.]|nr:carboxymuconolactone decarboxylase family protein [Sandaracinus sp.]